MAVFHAINGAPVVAIDTETTGLGFKDRPVGMSVTIPRGEGRYDDFYAAWGHGDGELEGNNCTWLEVLDWLEDEQRANPHTTFVFHNAGFDLRMLRYKGAKITNRVEDTGFVCALLNELEDEFTLDHLTEKYTDVHKQDEYLNEYCATRFGGKATRRSQAKNYWRAPGSVVEPYAVSDSRGTMRLYETRRRLLTDQGLDGVYEVECGQIPILLQMHMVGVRVDPARAHDVKVDFGVKREVAEWRWRELTGGVNFGSNKQLMQLFDRLAIPYDKNPETGNGIFDADALGGIDHEIARLITEQRELKHYENVFIDNYILANIEDDGCIHGEFHPLRSDRGYGTVSGRYSSGGALNLQNIPARDKIKGPLIRSMYIPYYTDQDWTKFDYSQIEYRFLAHYAGGAIAEAYRANPLADFHQMVADMTGLDRSPAKTLNFALVYGQGEEATAQQLKIPLEEARAFIAEYNGRAPEIRSLYNTAMRRAEARGTIITWGGRIRRFEMRRGRYDKTHKALNALLQGSAADLIKQSMIRVARLIDWEDAILHLTVHDELDLSITRGEVGDRYRKQIKEAMQDYELDVPVISDCEVGPNWGHVDEWLPAAA